MEEKRSLHNLTKISMMIALISAGTAINHMLIPTIILSLIAAIAGGILFYQEKKQKEKEKTDSNLALWSMLLGLAMLLSVILFDVLHL